MLSTSKVTFLKGKSGLWEGDLMLRGLVKGLGVCHHGDAFCSIFKKAGLDMPPLEANKIKEE